MKITIILVIIAISMTLLFSCTSSKYTPADYPNDQISFGNGGGVTGMYTEYVLFENGQLFMKKSNEEQYTKLPKANFNDADQIFKNYDILGLADYEYSKPGNITYYIHYKDQNREHRITWGDLGEDVKDEVKLYSKLLYKLVKEVK